MQTPERQPSDRASCPVFIVLIHSGLWATVALSKYSTSGIRSLRVLLVIRTGVIRRDTPKKKKITCIVLPKPCHAICVSV